MEPKRRPDTSAYAPGRQTANVAITLPISTLNALEAERAAAEKDPGRSGLIARILRDHYERREKELAGVA